MPASIRPEHDLPDAPVDIGLRQAFWWCVLLVYVALGLLVVALARP